MQEIMNVIKGYLILAMVFAVVCYLSPKEWSRKVLRFFAGILMVVYFLNCFTHGFVSFEIEGYDALCEKLWNLKYEDSLDYEADGEENWYEAFLEETYR